MASDYTHYIHCFTEYQNRQTIPSALVVHIVLALNLLACFWVNYFLSCKFNMGQGLVCQISGQKTQQRWFQRGNRSYSTIVHALKSLTEDAPLLVDVPPFWPSDSKFLPLELNQRKPWTLAHAKYSNRRCTLKKPTFSKSEKTSMYLWVLGRSQVTLAGILERSSRYSYLPSSVWSFGGHRSRIGR